MEEKQENLELNKDLRRVLITVIVLILIVVGLWILEQQTGFLSNLATQLMGKIVVK